MKTAKKMLDISPPATIGSAKLGFFSKPLLLTEGEHAGKVMKLYKFIADNSICQQILANHNNYVAMLEMAKIKIPPTSAEMVEHKNRFSIRIYQYAFSGENMARKIMESGDLTICISVMEGVLDGAITMLNYLHQNPSVTLGFHPTLRNYAICDETFWYFDTFPPMANISQGELEWFMLHFMPYKIPMWAKYLAKPFMHNVTDEYFDPCKMFLGIVGSSCRMRPEFISHFLEKAKFKSLELENTESRNSILSSLDNPPKLPFYWIFMRKIFGKEGKKNV